MRSKDSRCCGLVGGIDCTEAAMPLASLLSCTLCSLLSFTMSPYRHKEDHIDILASYVAELHLPSSLALLCQ